MSLEPNERQYQDIQVESQNCCSALMRGSSKDIPADGSLRHSQKSLRNSKQKGIQLTRKPKSFAKIDTQNRALLESPRPMKLNIHSCKKSDETFSPVPYLPDSQLTERRIQVVKKCIEYKNKKIQQHQNETEYTPHNLAAVNKEEELFSTRKNTARTLGNSYDYPLLQKPTTSFFANIPVESIFRSAQPQKSSNYKSQTRLHLNITHKKSKKTLEKVFQLTQGKRIVTLQSQFSNQQEYSVAEPFQFGERI